MIDQARPRKFTQWNVAEQVQHIMMTMGSSLSAVAMFNNISFARIRLVRDADANRGDRCFELEPVWLERSCKPVGKPQENDGQKWGVFARPGE